MCGIAGVINFSSEKVTKAHLKKMTDTLVHRGPNAEGQWVSVDGHVGLGHRRLSIIDLSDAGAQPMSYQNGRYTITFNGEIYNYLELRQDLISKGFYFSSNSDTEVLLALYGHYQDSMVDYLDGMFSFAIWDETEKLLFCARDRFGEKPFYYYRDSNQFVFASEMKALWAAGIPKIISEDKRKLYIEKGVIRTANTVDETFFEGIKILDAAHSLKIRVPRVDCEIKKYWTLDDISIDHSISFSQAIKKFNQLFKESVLRRLRSDVQVGSSLSGGLDSSSIVQTVEELTDDGYVQNTFSARFDNFSKDEGPFIDQMVQNCPSIHPNSTYPENGALLSLLKRAAHYHEEPIGSSSILAQWDVYRLASAKKVKVLIDGQGADEYLAGYIPIYNVYLHQLFIEKRLSYTKEHAHFTSMHDKRFHKPLKEFDNSIKNRLDYFTRQLKGLPSIDTDEKYNTLKQHLELLTTKTTLKELLRYADRNSMAHSVEVRLPFLSHKLVEFVHSLPNDFLLRKGWTKYILRNAMTKKLPKEICWRVDKIGYEPPQERWMKNSDVMDILRDQKIKYDVKIDVNASYTKSSDWRLLADYFL